MRGVAVATIVLAAAVLAGCSGAQQGPPEPRPELRFVTLDIETTPSEPAELRGPLHIAWGDGLVAIESASEPDLYHHTVLAGGTAYVSQAGRAWVRYDLEEALASARLSNRLLVWDLRSLVADPALDVVPADGGATVAVTGSTERLGVSFDIEARLLVEDGTVVGGTLASPQARESPFTFHRSTATVATTVPSPAFGERELIGLDGDARTAHESLLDLVTRYQANHAGTLPEALSPQTLQLELVQTGRDWPDSPFDGLPMEHADRSGHFLWKRCTLTTGNYLGLGGDAPLLDKAFGTCSQQAGVASSP